MQSGIHRGCNGCKLSSYRVRFMGVDSQICTHTGVRPNSIPVEVRKLEKALFGIEFNVLTLILPVANKGISETPSPIYKRCAQAGLDKLDL